MSSVLILDDRSNKRRYIENGLKRYHTQFQILTAATIQKSLQVIAASRISILICNTNLGSKLLPLLIEVLLQRPPIPCILLSDKEIEQLPEPDSTDGLVVFLYKPFKFNMIGEWILRWLDHLDEGWNGNGVSGKIFISLVEALGASCQTEIQSAESESGYLNFNKGRLIEARYRDQTGHAAIEKIVPWENINILIQKNAKKGSTDSFGRPPAQESQSRKTDGISARSFKIDAEILSRANNIFKEFEYINGFKAVGIFSSQPELLTESYSGGIQSAGLKMLIEEILTGTQTTMDTMGFGQWNLIHVESANSHIVIKRWFTPSGDKDDAGNLTLLFIALILDRDGSLANGKMLLERFSAQPT